jgi:hypothetical protein
VLVLVVNDVDVLVYVEVDAQVLQDVEYDFNDSLTLMCSLMWMCW